MPPRPARCARSEYKMRSRASGSSKDAVTTEEVDLDLHGVTHPTEDVDVVPTLFIVATWWVVVDTYLVKDISIKVWVVAWVKNVFKYTEL